MSKSGGLGVGIVSLAALFPSLLAGQSTVRVGSDFQVNLYTTSGQETPDVALDADGDFVVAWRSNGQDGDLNGVFGRRFNSAGTAQAGEFQINNVTVGVQFGPEVSLDASGDFVIAWTGADGGGQGVFARRFNASGVPQAAEFLVNSYTIGNQFVPGLDLDGDGDFVVAWASDEEDGDGGGVFARRFNASGTPGPVFQVNSHTQSSQRFPAVALDEDGDFVVVWNSMFQDGDLYGVFGQRFNALGVALSTEFHVSSYTVGNQARPRADMDGDGDFVVVWHDSAQDGSGFGIIARRFNSVGAAASAELRVNSFATGNQFFPDVALSDAGDFVVTWESEGQDGSAYGAFARHFDASGAPLEPEVQVNRYTTGWQGGARIGLDGARKFVVAWSGETDGSSYGIFAQRFKTLAILDVDGDGSTQALTDGLLILRFLFGFTGATLTNGAVDGDCTRCTAPSIEAYLQGLT